MTQITSIKNECTYSDTDADKISSTSNTTLPPSKTASEAASFPNCKIEHRMLINPPIQGYAICNESLSNPQPFSQMPTNQFSEVIIDPNVSVSITMNDYEKNFMFI
uniref:Uncharacterized protein n=1 Tax=Strongyloides papillosus TaxID=174720 RepID=A0A0N5BQB4_STREA